MFKPLLKISAIISLAIGLQACAIPDLPGPIGIPGIEAPADSEQFSLIDSKRYQP